MAKRKRLTKETSRSKLATSRRFSAKTLQGFITFIRTQGVVGLAVGLVLGGAVATVVKSLISNVVMPPIGLLLGSSEGLNNLSVYLGKASDGKEAVLHYGTFLNDLIDFLIIALVIYLVVHLLGFDKLDQQKEE